MRFSKLLEKYDDMHQPGFTLQVDGKELAAAEDVRLTLLTCELTSRRPAGFLYLEAALNPKGDHGAVWLDALAVGARCSLALGYGRQQEEVFVGFLYDAAWDDPLDGEEMTLSALFLDVRGKMMLSSCADAGAARTMAQLLDAILNQSGCSALASSRKIGGVPADWDLPAQRAGLTDFDVVCQAADFLCCEFYAYADELYFGVPQPDPSPCVVFDSPNGLIRLRRRRTLAGQCAAVSVSGTDDKGERIFASQARAGDSGFGGGKMGGALSGALHQPEPGVRTMAQAQYLSKARMAERQRRAGGLTGQCVGLPELRPGRFVEASGMSRPVNGSYYVHTVRHTLDGSGFETYFEAEE